MNVDEFLQRYENALKCKTIYAKGGFGITLTDAGKKRVIEAYAYNKKRADKINAMPKDSFAFDCCGAVKGIVWGFIGDPKKVYGGAVYKSNGLPDVSEKGLLDLCHGVSSTKDNTAILPGEFLYMKGHCGIYAGNGYVYEATPSGADGLQKTSLGFQKWEKHGFLNFIEYNKKPDVQIVAKPTLRFGSKGMQVDYLQKNLNSLGLCEALDIDGIFGKLTERSLKTFQAKYHLSVDGIYGPKSYAKMQEVIR